MDYADVPVYVSVLHKVTSIRRSCQNPWFLLRCPACFSASVRRQMAISMYAGAGLAVIFFMTLYKRYKGMPGCERSQNCRIINPLYKALNGMYSLCLHEVRVFFIVVPLIIYFCIVSRDRHAGMPDFQGYWKTSRIYRFSSAFDPDKGASVCFHINGTAGQWMCAVLFFNGHNTADRNNFHTVYNGKSAYLVDRRCRVFG